MQVSNSETRQARSTHGCITRLRFFIERSSIIAQFIAIKDRFVREDMQLLWVLTFVQSDEVCK